MALDLETLNPEQREAVECTDGPLLVLAGAGSGKTRVLTYRIAHLIEDLNVAPWQILAITFTNKAANEMRERLGSLVGPATSGMWVSTFHSMCVRMLRADAQRLGFSESFTIYDDSDSKRLIKEIMEGLFIDPRRFPVNTIKNRISTAKNELIMPDEFARQAVDPIAKRTAEVYAQLQKRLRQANAFDFDDLLVYAYLLLKHHPEVLAAYQRRFRYILVDEYQDTNHAQYAITRLLARRYQNIMVVGDDDQSIYSWRGADIRNIFEFEQDYPSAHVVKLEKNYRSTATILKAANAVIANNVHRKSKKLVSTGKEGSKIQIYMASDERDEGRWIASEIERRHHAGMSYERIAVFYRTNAQSRMLEDMLLRAGVPYRIVGGTRFFDRSEIRDLMAYVSLVINPANDIAAKRIINVPRRGIGPTTLNAIETIARDNGTTFLEAAHLAAKDERIRPVTRRALAELTTFIDEAATWDGDLRKVVEMIVDRSGLVRALEDEDSDEARNRVENIKEFLGVVDEFVATHDVEEAVFAAPVAGGGSVSLDHSEETLSETDQASAIVSDGQDEPVRILRGDSLADFLEWVTLRTDLDTVAQDNTAAILMTVHAAKGLEFDCVFVAGMEESIFPHMNSMHDPSGIEEERRLAYVAITRARKYLYLTCAGKRRLYGQLQANPISRFLGEIPQTLRTTSGLGSVGLSGTGWEKRGSRQGISGSGHEAGEGRVFGRSSASAFSQRVPTVCGTKTHGTDTSRVEAHTAEAYRKEAAHSTFRKGDLIDHTVFGRGTVTAVDGDMLSVCFAKTGSVKKLLKDFAPIVKIKKQS